jgi:hypothetical protein
MRLDELVDLIERAKQQADEVQVPLNEVRVRMTYQPTWPLVSEVKTVAFVQENALTREEEQEYDEFMAADSKFDGGEWSDCLREEPPEPKWEFLIAEGSQRESYPYLHEAEQEQLNVEWGMQR